MAVQGTHVVMAPGSSRAYRHPGDFRLQAAAQIMGICMGKMGHTYQAAGSLLEA